MACKRLALVLSVLAIGAAFSYETTTPYAVDSIATAMEEHGVIPDVIDIAPTEIAQVSYPNDIKVNQGNELEPKQVKDTPTVKWTADPKSYYTLVKIDPDAPSRKEPKFREFLHWIVGNIAGDDITTGDTISAYIGAGPPEGTDIHRYVFLIYKQPGKVTFEEKPVSNTSKEGRPSFSVKKFAAKYKLGDPVAGNFYRAQFDDYVPILHKQLS